MCSSFCFLHVFVAWPRRYLLRAALRPVGATADAVSDAPSPNGVCVKPQGQSRAPPSNAECPGYCSGHRTLRASFEELHLAEAFLGLLHSLVRPAKILSFLGKHLVSVLHFANHLSPSFTSVLIFSRRLRATLRARPVSVCERVEVLSVIEPVGRDIVRLAEDPSVFVLLCVVTISVLSSKLTSVKY